MNDESRRPGEGDGSAISLGSDGTSLTTSPAIPPVIARHWLRLDRVLEARSAGGDIAIFGRAGVTFLDRKTIEALAGLSVDLLNITDPDPDAEDDDPGEDDDPREEDDPGEDDDPDQGSDEGEPSFRDPLSSRGHGAGCIISDSDYGAEDQGEEDEAARLDPPIYGVDQTKGPLNEREAHRSFLAAERLEGR